MKTPERDSHPVASIKIILADDHRMVLSALRHLLGVRGDCQILAEAQDIGVLLSLPELPLMS